LVPAIVNSKHHVKLYIGDNNSNDELVSYLKEYHNKPYCQLTLSPKNLGKANMINLLHSKARKCEIVITIDTDLVTINNNWIDEIVDCLSNNKEFGVLSTEQLTNGQHLKKRFDKIKEYNGHKILYGSFTGVAGGCVVMTNDDWNTVGGYRSFGVYGGVDATLMQNVNRMLKKECGVVETIPLDHPFDDDKGYEKWKHDNISLSKTSSIGYFDKG